MTFLSSSFAVLSNGSRARPLKRRKEKPRRMTNVQYSKWILLKILQQNIKMKCNQPTGTRSRSLYSEVWCGAVRVTNHYAVISDSLNHDKVTVNCFLVKVLNDLKKVFPNVQEVKIFSDGAASQFKIKYIFQLLCTLQDMLQLKLEWHFSATSHGKGAVDGIGGTVKRTVLRAVNSRQCIVSGAESFLSVAKKNNTKVKLLLVLSNEVVEAAQNQCYQ